MFSQNAYVKGTMTKDEEIKVEAKYHWIKWLWFYFMFATLGVVALVSFSLAFTSYLDKQTDMAAALLIMACVLGVYPFLLYLSLLFLFSHSCFSDTCCFYYTLFFRR